MAPRNGEVRLAQSSATDTRDAVREFHDAVAQPDMALVAFFCSSQYDLDVLAQEMKARFADVQVVGCTTAGEIGPQGCIEHSITGFSLPASSFAAVSGVLTGLQEFEFSQARHLVEGLLENLRDLDRGADSANSFALLLADGLSVREEPLARALQHVLGDLRLVGGSAGDDLQFNRTYVYAGGQFRRDSALLVLITTPRPFEVFCAAHPVPTDRRVVVTAADAEHRIVHELDGWPAAEAYARLVGVDVSDLGPMQFAESPVLVKIDGTNFVRSIQRANPDASLTFFSAVEEGMVLRLARGEDLLGHLKQRLDGLRAVIGPPDLVIAFDCVLRKQEVIRLGLVDTVGDIFRQNNTVGFNSYGEQYRGVHINQTLTGVFLGGDHHG